MKQAKRRKYKFISCWCFGEIHRVQRIYTARQPTAYADDKMNFFTGCFTGHKENNANWEAQWREYYSSQGY